MSELMFIDGFRAGWIYILNAQCKTMDFHCSSPLKCEVLFNGDVNMNQRDTKKLARLNEELDKLTGRYNKIMMFW